LFSFDLQRKKWENIELVGESPSERTDHSSVLYDGSLYIFGGYDGKTRFGDMYKCNLKSGTFKWRKIEGDGIPPLNRFGHTACLFEHSMFIFGGWNGHDTMDDIYQYSFCNNSVVAHPLYSI
jgi:N-acetylneuraminic acid mutarotase